MAEMPPNQEISTVGGGDDLSCQGGFRGDEGEDLGFALRESSSRSSRPLFEESDWSVEARLGNASFASGILRAAGPRAASFQWAGLDSFKNRRLEKLVAEAP